MKYDSMSVVEKYRYNVRVLVCVFGRYYQLFAVAGELLGGVTPVSFVGKDCRTIVPRPLSFRPHLGVALRLDLFDSL